MRAVCDARVTVIAACAQFAMHVWPSSLHARNLRFLMRRRCRRDRHELMRVIADASQVTCATFLMLRRCRRDRHDLLRAIADASQGSCATFLMRRMCRRDRHELMRAIADASQVACATLHYITLHTLNAADDTLHICRIVLRRFF